MGGSSHGQLAKPRVSRQGAYLRSQPPIQACAGVAETCKCCSQLPPALVSPCECRSPHPQLLRALGTPAEPQTPEGGPRGVRAVLGWNPNSTPNASV